MTDVPGFDCRRLNMSNDSHRMYVRHSNDIADVTGE